MISNQPVCIWCCCPFHPRTTGGSEQRFCSPAHRHAFGSAARRWAVLAIERGVISVATLKAAGTSAHAAGGAF
jgi:hypothetical protein